jgi:hypothetical protein
MCFVADSVNLWTKPLPRSGRILIEQRLNAHVVLLKQRPNLVLLFCGQLLRMDSDLLEHPRRHSRGDID